MILFYPPMPFVVLSVLEGAMELSKEQIDEIVKALMGGHAVLTTYAEEITAKLTRAFGRERNPYAGWSGGHGPLGLAADLFDAAAKVADQCDNDGIGVVRHDDHSIARAALKKIVARIREVRG